MWVLRFFLFISKGVLLLTAMTTILWLTAVVILGCVLFQRLSGKVGVPALLFFILLGMFFGTDGVVKIPFDNFELAQNVCSVALLFIMFYGGFGTNVRSARPVAAEAVLLSSVGTVLTAGLVGVFCHFVLGVALWESFLIGAVISSTDAASVFSVLRSRHLNLKYHTASLLEVESGSNDPFSYMLTTIVLSVMHGGSSGGQFAAMLAAQIGYGVLLGVVLALAARWVLGRFRFSAGFDAVFAVAVALLSYVLPEMLGGNGYLSVYLTGMILGNSRIPNKSGLVHFFDAATALMQMVLFFLLGLLAFPSQLPRIAPRALLIALFLTFVARPAVVALLLTPFRAPLRQQLLVSWSGLRGAASIVFAIMATMHPAVMQNDVFHIVFFIVLFSVLLQGTCLPRVAAKLGMTDDGADVMKTFTDYVDEVPVQFIRFSLPEGHPWAGQAVRQVVLPPASILVLVLRGDRRIVPDGSVQLQAGDTLILSGTAAGAVEGVHLYEKTLDADSSWLDQPLCRIHTGDRLVILVRRGARILIPDGDTVLRLGDRLVINDPQSKS